MVLSLFTPKLTIMKIILSSFLLLVSTLLLPINIVQSQDKTIVEIASENDDFETLVAAVKAADLVETLNGKGNFTVFAPTDAAFDALPAGLLDALLMPKNKAVLQKILTYHVVGSKLNATDVISGIKGKGGMLAATTVEGSDFTAMLKDGKVMIKDGRGKRSDRCDYRYHGQQRGNSRNRPRYSSGGGRTGCLTRQ